MEHDRRRSGLRSGPERKVEGSEGGGGRELAVKTVAGNSQRECWGGVPQGGVHFTTSRQVSKTT